MKKYLYAFIFVIGMLFNGCGSGSNGGSGSSNLSNQGIVSLSSSSVGLFGGESETFILRLDEEALSSGVKSSIVTSLLNAVAGNEHTYTVQLSTGDTNIATVSPSSCTLSSSNPTCQVTITAVNQATTSTSTVISKSTVLNSLHENILSQVATITTSSINGRYISVENNCGYDVWMSFEASSAAQIACTPSSTSAQSNCPSGYVCYNKSSTTNYCVPGTTTATNFTNITQGSVSLNASKCATGQIVSDTSSTQWGQCSCNFGAAAGSTGGCPSGQVCQQVTSTINQCYFDTQYLGSTDFMNTGHVPAGTVEQNASGGLPKVIMPLSYNPTNTIFTSGNLYFKTGCASDGTNCLSGVSTTPTPNTRIEYTFGNTGNDYYDVSYIGGINVPAKMSPSFKDSNITFTAQASNQYFCTPAGGTNTDYTNPPSGFSISSGLNGWGSTLDWDSAIQNNSALLGWNFVTAGGQTCSASNNSCPSGQVCGLAYATVAANSTQLTCGTRLGYWSYAQLCSVATTTSGAWQNQYVNSTLGVDCSNTTTASYSLCTQVSGYSGTGGPARSCFNSNQTSTGQTCCGYTAWSNTNGAMPTTTGQNSQSTAVSGVFTTEWSNSVGSAVAFIKNSGMTAYSFQFDDPYSTFQCAYQTQLSKLTNQNGTNYRITLCPQNKNAGIGVANSAMCSASVSGTYSASGSTVNLNVNNFQLALPSNVNLTSVTTKNGTNSTVAAVSGSGTQSIYYQLGTSATSSTPWAGEILIKVQSTQDNTYLTCAYNTINGSCFSVNKLDSTNQTLCSNWISGSNVSGFAMKGRYFGVAPFTGGASQ